MQFNSTVSNPGTYDFTRIGKLLQSPDLSDLAKVNKFIEIGGFNLHRSSFSLSTQEEKNIEKVLRMILETAPWKNVPNDRREDLVTEFRSDMLPGVTLQDFSQKFVPPLDIAWFEEAPFAGLLNKKNQ